MWVARVTINREGRVVRKPADDDFGSDLSDRQVIKGVLVAVAVCVFVLVVVGWL